MNLARSSWKRMISRCHNPLDQNFAHYSARGITVCARWRESFDAFLSDAGPRPSTGHSLDRIDNDRGYEPGNVRWATATEQARNRSSVRYVTVNGERLVLTEAAAKYGVRRKLIAWRLSNGWSEHEAVTVPSQNKKKVAADVCARGHLRDDPSDSYRCRVCMKEAGQRWRERQKEAAR